MWFFVGRLCRQRAGSGKWWKCVHIDRIQIFINTKRLCMNLLLSHSDVHSSFDSLNADKYDGKLMSFVLRCALQLDTTGCIIGEFA